MIKKLFLNDKFILGLILVNSVLLFLEGYISKDQHFHLILILDNIITSLFIIEIIVKFRVLGIKNYFQSNWNCFDFILVALSLPALVTYILNINLFDVSFVLAFRVLRLFKTFRFLKFVPNISELIRGVHRALKASIFVLVGFIVYVFVLGILSFHLFSSSGSEYFSDPMISLYSIFKIFTVEGWFEIPEQIIMGYSESASFFIYLYFIFVVLTGGIFGLSLVNSILVDAMVSDNNDELEEKIDHLNDKVNQILDKMNEKEK